MICSTCTKTKDETDFAWRNKEKGKRHSKCKDCQNIYSSARYKSKPEEHKKKVKQNRPFLKQKNKEFLLEYLKTHPCIDCGNSDIRVLQFDHKKLKSEDSEKRRGFSESLTSRPKLIAELAKCDVRCANCHMIRTAEQLGWVRI